MHNRMILATIVIFTLIVQAGVSAQAQSRSQRAKALAAYRQKNAAVRMQMAQRLAEINRLQVLCRAAIFQRYGSPMSSPNSYTPDAQPGRRILEMNADTLFARTESCVRTRGKIF